MMDRFRVVNGIEEPNLLEISDPMTNTVWPEFMLKDPIANKYWGKLFEYFPAYQFGLFDKKTDELVAVANSLPLEVTTSLTEIPEEGWDWVLEKGMVDFERGRSPNIQSALAIAIKQNAQGQGLSRGIIGLMKAVGEKEHLPKLIAPVRPNLKALYPLADINRYIHWTNGNGAPFDAWIRVHASLGAEIVKVCPRSMVISGSIDEWESWAGMRFPVTGEYVVPGALNPVQIDCERDMGVYIEPNVLMVHEI